MSFKQLAGESIAKA
jgi:hypothetical protein